GLAAVVEALERDVGLGVDVVLDALGHDRVTTLNDVEHDTVLLEGVHHRVVPYERVSLTRITLASCFVSASPPANAWKIAFTNSMWRLSSSMRLATVSSPAAVADASAFSTISIAGSSSLRFFARARSLAPLVMSSSAV